MGRLLSRTQRSEDKGMYVPETPSRVMRRILSLEALEDDMPTLPTLPSFSDADETFPDSPPARSNKVLPDPALQSPLATTTIPNNNTPMYTSTPAPSSGYLRSQNSLPSSSSSASLNTTLGPKGRRAVNQHFPTSVLEDDELELPSLDDDASSIGKADSLEEDREDMVVLSGSGEESAGGSRVEARLARMGSRQSPSYVKELVDTASEGEDDDQAADSSSVGSLDAYFKSANLSAALDNLDDSASQSPAPANPHPYDYSMPLESGDDDDVAVPSSERARRLSAAASHVSMIRRKPSRKSMAAVSFASDQNSPFLPPQLDADTPGKAADPSASLQLPSTFSPLRELANDTDGSPGIGRHASPHSSPHSQILHVRETYTPSPSQHSNQLSRAFATPHFEVSIEQTDADRRKEHLLMTLRSTTKPRMAKGTPHPVRRRAPSSAGGGEAGEGSFISDEASSHDLTTHQHANTSLPTSGGVAEKSTRFNGAKLNAYLHSLNTHLTEENQTLVKTLGSTTKEVARLTQRVKEMSMIGGSSSSMEEDSRRESERSRVEVLGAQLEGLVESHGGINVLKQQLVGELGKSGTVAVVDIAASTRIADLEAQVEKATRALQDREVEIETLREQVVEAQGSSSNDQGRDELVKELQREVFELKDQLGDAVSDKDAKVDEIESLRSDFVSAGEANEAELAGLHARADELLVELEEKDAELEAARGELGEQEAEFAEKMQQLEEELCRVMEEQEAQLDAAQADLEEKRREDDKYRKEEGSKVAETRRQLEVAEVALEEMKAERDGLERRIAAEGSTADSESTQLVLKLRQDVTRLEATVAERDGEIRRMNAEMDDFETKLDGLDAGESESRRLLDAQAESLQQVEEALDESARQLLQNEEDIDGLRAALASERKTVQSLSAQISQLGLHKTKAKSPLANEVFSNSSDVVALEAELETAYQEIGQLKEQLASPTAKATVELKDLQIKTLETNKVQMEERLESLRHQVQIQLTPSKTPDKSLFFKSIVGLATPRTPGQFLNNLPAWSPGVEGNSTITPLLAQIHELELIVEQLQAQLSAANVQIDSKLDRLEAAGSGTISLARQLSAARERIAHLEAELDRLFGDRGTLHRLRTKLSTLNCPSCRTTFDANKLIRLVFDKASSGITFAGDSSADSDSTTSIIYTALQKEFESAKSEINVLQDERVEILRGVSSLQSDLNKVREDAINLGVDLAAVRRERDEIGQRNAGDEMEMSRLQDELVKHRRKLAVYQQKVTDHVCPSDANALVEMKARHSQEAKGLLIMIRYLKLCVTREATFREDMAYQKDYLSTLIGEKQSTIDSTLAKLNDLGLHRPIPQRRPKVTLRGAAMAVIAISRMSALSRTWKEQNVPKDRLRTQAYPDVRGHPYVG